MLLHDVGQHAEAGRQSQPIDEASQLFFEPDDRVDIVAGGVHSEDDVATAIRQPFEDREQDFLLVIARAVRLNARSEVGA